MTKLIILIFIFQQPEWVYQYVHPSIADEWPRSMVVDSNGNTYTTGVIGPEDTTQIVRLGIIKLNTYGEEKWIYTDDSLREGMDIDCRFNRIYVTGLTEYQTGKLMYLKVDTSGNKLFTYISDFSGRGNAIDVSLSHHIYIAGLKYPSPSDIVVLKLDSLGNEIWRYVYDGPAGSYDEATDIVVDRNENIYVAGYSTGIGSSFDFILIKLDSSGNKIWEYRYNGPANYWDEVKKMAIDSSGNIYITGRSWGIDADWAVVKVDSSGDERWVYRYNGSGNAYDEPFDLVVDDSGNVYVAGVTGDTTGLFTVIKLDSSGNERWRYTQNGAATSIIFNKLGGIYVGGKNKVILFNSSGDTIWTYRYNSIFVDIVADVNGNVYLTGRKYVSQWDTDIIIMKFPAQTNIKENYNAKRIEYLDNKGQMTFDILGRRVKGGFSNKGGIYFLKEKNRFKKMIFLRR